jgi:hypothetical protein
MSRVKVIEVINYGPEEFLGGAKFYYSQNVDADSVYLRNSIPVYFPTVN